MPTLQVIELLDESYQLELGPLYEGADYHRIITGVGINRPGLALTGFFENFAADRVQIFGRGETSFLESLSETDCKECAEKFFSYDIPCIIFSHKLNPPDLFLQVAIDKKIPVFFAPYSTMRLSAILNDVIDLRTSPRTVSHGVLLEVFGIGVLITGKTGVGKSETALELIELGHRLIADDAVHLYKRGEFHLHGSVSENIAYYMEIRGLGIINIKDLYGAGSVRKDIRIELIVALEEWKDQHEYDRTGLDEKTSEILGVEIPCLLIPVKPGRNIPLLIETAAKNFRLKGMGYHPAREFNRMLMEKMKPSEPGKAKEADNDN
ncbi:MAG: HPr(Ser) kinase/phosphatase [Leptospirales bacterium]